MTNVDPPEDIPRGQQSKFRGLYGKCIQQKLVKFPETSVRETLREEIDQQRAHRKLISYATFPFAEEAPAGYKFITAEPLEELGVKNVDFLLFDFDGHAILGEAKASIPKNATRVVNQLSERREQIENHQEYLVDEYLGAQIDDLEFVLVTYVQHGDKIAKEIAEEGEEVITWVVDPHSDRLWLNQARPDSFPDNIESEDPDEMLEELNRRLTHNVAKLNSELDRIRTGFGQVDILPTSIIVDRLRVVVQARRVVERYACIDRIDIQQYVSQSALNFSEERIEVIVSDLIEAGKRINFLADWEDERADFKIVSNYTSRDDLERVLERKWLDWRVEKKKDKLRESCREKARKEIDKQSQLTDFQ